jgi:hypothetical protein
MLNERGVEYRWDNGTVTWYVDGVMYNAWGFDNERLTMSVCHLTPEQAIAATVGAGTCHVKAAKKLGDLFGFSLSCGHSMVNPFNDHPDYCPWCGAKVVDE